MTLDGVLMLDATADAFVEEVVGVVEAKRKRKPNFNWDDCEAEDDGVEAEENWQLDCRAAACAEGGAFGEDEPMEQAFCLREEGPMFADEPMPQASAWEVRTSSGRQPKRRKKEAAAGVGKPILQVFGGPGGPPTAGSDRFEAVRLRILARGIASNAAGGSRF